jgi:ankyrin repeat protein
MKILHRKLLSLLLAPACVFISCKSCTYGHYQNGCFYGYAYSPLHETVFEGNLGKIIDIISSEGNVNQRYIRENFWENDDYATPLCIAAECGHIEIVKYLIKQNANVNLGDQEGNTPLHKAVMFARKDIVQLLIDNNANLNAKNSSGKTPLQSCFDSHARCILDDGSTIPCYNGFPFVTEKANKLYDNYFKHPEKESIKNTVKILLSNDANLEAKDKKGRTLLHRRVTAGDIEFVQFLISNGAYIDSKDNKNRTPLLYAIWHNHTEVVKCLFKHGATICDQVVLITENKH